MDYIIIFLSPATPKACGQLWGQRLDPLSSLPRYIGRGPVGSVQIHLDAFEFTFCKPDLFRNIHVDIPPKYMSFVFYFPTSDLTDDKEQRNATVLYNSKLEAVYGTGFRKNSICIFVRRFYSYHGFATTIDRDIILVLLVNKPERIRQEHSDCLVNAPQGRVMIG